MRNASVVIAALGVIILAALFFAFKSNQTVIAPTPTPSSASSSATMNSKVFNLVVKNNKLVSGPDVLQVNQGDHVTINITADVDGELHLHGYNIPVEFKKDQTASLAFDATISGRFPYELEDTKTEIGAVEVQPK